MRSDSPAGLPAALCRDASSPPSARVLGESLGTTELQVLEAAFQRHPGGCRAPAPRAATVLALQRLWMQLGRAALLLQWHPHSQLRLIVSCLFYLLQEAHARDSHVGGVGRVWGGPYVGIRVGAAPGWPSHCHRPMPGKWVWAQSQPHSSQPFLIPSQAAGTHLGILRADSGMSWPWGRLWAKGGPGRARGGQAFPGAPPANWAGGRVD